MHPVRASAAVRPSPCLREGGFYGLCNLGGYGESMEIDIPFSFSCFLFFGQEYFVFMEEEEVKG